MSFENLDKLDKISITVTTILGVIVVGFFTWFLWPEPKAPELGPDLGRGGRDNIVKIEEGRGGEPGRIGRENMPREEGRMEAPMPEEGRPNVEVGPLETTESE